MKFKILSKLCAIALLTGILISPVCARVYMQKEEALKQAFPAADNIDAVNLYLSEKEIEQVYHASGVRPDSALYTFYVGSKNGSVTGYAAIEAATVRTLPETVIVVLEPDGSIRYAEILAFFEPAEYKPSERWMDQFPGVVLSRNLRVGGEIHGISGATLSAHAITRQVRKSAAMLKIYLKGNIQ
jgi:hypothetical protein